MSYYAQTEWLDEKAHRDFERGLRAPLGKQASRGVTELMGAMRMAGPGRRAAAPTTPSRPKEIRA